MPLTAVLAVLLAAATHATWNLYAKRAAGSRHFVWLYSMGSVLIYTPIVLSIVLLDRPQFGLRHWLALSATAVLHLCYSLMLQAGYRASDLSLVYPLARGSGPLLSFFAAVILLGEHITTLSVLGVVLVVSGILLVSGLLLEPHKAPRAGILYGLGTGAFIAAYTINDGWAVKVLMISPFIVDYVGNLFRVMVLAPRAWTDRSRLREEVRLYLKPALVVSVLGPLGYILVLYAMRVAPISHVAPMRELATLIGTWFGARLLREKSAPQRIFGAVCIVAGVVSLALADAR
ncbi:DMT family transporter [Povalibacter sp.]|uniref:DMT family transporter n=1 Tax=Povalibacter sp. TaxID=1962978 RepID=UPI002F3E9147